MLILQFFLEGLWFPCWLQSASFRRQGYMVLFSGDTCGVPGYYKSASFRRPTLVWGFPARLRCTGLLGIGVLLTPWLTEEGDRDIRGYSRSAKSNKFVLRSTYAYI